MSEVTIYKTGYFESAHLLKGHPKCGKLHGHSYRYEVWITGELSGEFDFVMDFHEIKQYFDRLDHSDKILTMPCERLAEIATEHFLDTEYKIAEIKVRIWETATSYAECLRSPI